MNYACYQRAIADFEAALVVDPKMAQALYGRGLARIGSGDVARGNADIAAARAIEPQCCKLASTASVDALARCESMLVAICSDILLHQRCECRSI